MCFYDRIRYSCSHIYWSNLKAKCDSSAEPCKIRKVSKGGYFRSERLCALCNGDLNYRSNFNPSSVERPPQRCTWENCRLHMGHDGDHDLYWICEVDGCGLGGNHSGPHGELVPTSRAAASRWEAQMQKYEKTMHALSLLVLEAMGIAIRPWPPSVSQAPPSVLNEMSDPSHIWDNQLLPCSLYLELEDGRRPEVVKKVENLYTVLDLRAQEIRLFELFPAAQDGQIRGTFYHVTLFSNPSYIALSYTWGDPEAVETIEVDNQTIQVRRNLWEFLRQQSFTISKPTRFWIDALCIDQSDVYERNHQVNLMQDIYVRAAQVYIWLGPESENSEIAMDYITTKSGKALAVQGLGYRKIWTREQGRALRDLCERPYWRRMWVIQEIVHANNITVCCGAKNFTWDHVERLYLKLKVLQDTHWFPHHEYSIQVLQSSAAVMVWQRAHWRHPDTPVPTLRTLIEVFRNWQCSEIRDKVFALVSMASRDTTIVPDYSQSARDVYAAVCNKHPDAGWQFENMLSQVLGLSARDIKINGRDLIEYKVHPSDTWLLRKRVHNDW